MLIPPYIKSFIKQENKHFLFKIKYVLFDKIEAFKMHDFIINNIY